MSDMSIEESRLHTEALEREVEEAIRVADEEDFSLSNAEYAEDVRSDYHQARINLAEKVIEEVARIRREEPVSGVAQLALIDKALHDGGF